MILSNETILKITCSDRLYEAFGRCSLYKVDEFKSKLRDIIACEDSYVLKHLDYEPYKYIILDV